MSDFDLLLMDYALGNVSVEDRALVEHELQKDATLRERLKELQELLVHSSPTANAPNALRQRIVESVSAETRFSGFAERLAELVHLPLARAREILQVTSEFSSLSSNDQPVNSEQSQESCQDSTQSLRWEASLISGMHALHFKPGDTLQVEDCGVVHMEPGTVFPVHSHQGDEATFVLQGEFTDDDGTVYLPGDVFFKNTEHEHSYQATGDIALVFVVFHNGIEII